MLTGLPRVTSAPEPELDYLGSVLQELWPAPAAISRGRGVKSRTSTRTSYAVVPSLTRPKLVLPRDPARATANALRNYNAFLTGSARAKVTALAWLARLGLARYWPHQVHVDVPRGADLDSIDTYLATSLGREIRTCLYVGPTRAVQKPVLQLLSATGDTFGFAKVGTNSLTRALVRNEAANLAVVADAHLTRMRVPAVLHAGRWGRHEVLVTRALTDTGSGRVPALDLAAASVELSKVGGLEPCELDESPYWQRLSLRMKGLPQGALADALSAAFARVRAAAGSTRLTFGSWHGDWAPWNMTMADQILVWDLEQFEQGVPVGFDAIHHAVQSSVVFDGASPRAAFERAEQDAARLLAPHSVAPGAHQLMVLLYLIEIATRYLHDGEVRSGGTTLGRLDTWLQPVLEERVHALRLTPDR